MQNYSLPAYLSSYQNLNFLGYGSLFHIIMVLYYSIEISDDWFHCKITSLALKALTDGSRDIHLKLKSLPAVTHDIGLFV